MKTGIVFEGGASRTAFTNGVIDELLRADVRVNYVIGTSAGIGNGLSFISRQIGRNLRISMQRETGAITIFLLYLPRSPIIIARWTTRRFPALRERSTPA